jgi:hypothetical protein
MGYWGGGLVGDVGCRRRLCWAVLLAFVLLFKMPDASFGVAL